MDRPNLPLRKLLRSPSLKRKNKALPLNERCKLERVLGLTVSSTCCLSVDLSSGTIAYPAGCVVVLYNPKKNRYSHIINSCKKTITCLCFSADGKYLATGESGHQPAVRVWDVAEKTQVTEFMGHKFAISCVAFSPNMKYLVSIGNQHDMGVNVYSWRGNGKVASNKVATQVTDIAFNDASSMFVTAGNRHVKFWYMDSSKSKINQTVPLHGRSGLLGDQKNNLFSGVACGEGAGASTFAITQSGLLCEFNEKRLLTRWVELRAPSANGLSLSGDRLYIACAGGTVRTFDAKTLTFIGSLPQPHHLGIDVAAGFDQISHLPLDRPVQYPDTLAVCYDSKNQKLTCVYSDHSLYVWDVQNMAKVGKARSFLFHSACIWNLEMYPVMESSERALPDGSFLTCSGDDTIRVWNVDGHMDNSSSYKRNIYSNELLKVVYTDNELNHLVPKDTPSGTKTDKTSSTASDKAGVRSIRISPDGKELASGDRIGNIRIHELSTMDQTNSLEAHDSEVLCLEFCKPQLGVRLLASASRDRLLHIFDRDQDYGLVQTLDDHSAAIPAIRFLESAGEGQLHMVSAGADKSLLFRTAQQDPEFSFVLQRHLVGKTTLYDMDVDPSGNYLATACQDRQVRIYNVRSGKQKKAYSGAVSSEGVLLKVTIDSTGGYIATSCDKVVSVYDFFSGECVASMTGHSEVITCIKFTNDHKHIISVAGDGCIFIWRLPVEVTEHMRKREADQGIKSQSAVSTEDLSKKNDEVDSPNKAVNGLTDVHKPSYKFSVGSLPSWAKRQVLQETPTPKAASLSNLSAPAKGRWAQRVEKSSSFVSDLDDLAVEYGADTPKDQSRFTLDDIVLTDPSLVPSKAQVAIINDDEFNKDEEEDEFTAMVANEGEPTSPKNMEDKVRWTRGTEVFTLADLGLQQSFDEDADVGMDTMEEGDATEDDIIFYPQKDELKDANENSFRVFEGEKASSVDTSSDLADTEDGSDDDTSSAPTPDAPSTPCDENAPDEDQFLRANFEALEKLDAEDESRLNNPRLSISSRFLSRTHLQYLRSVSKDLGKDAGSSSSVLSKRRTDMAKAVEETRKRLQALGWNIGGGTSVKEVNRDTGGLQSVPEVIPSSEVKAGPVTSDLNPSHFFTPLSFHNQNKDETAENSVSSGMSSPVDSKSREVDVAAPGTPDRRRWNLPASPVPNAEPKKWKSMIDMVGGPQTEPAPLSPRHAPHCISTLPRSPLSPRLKLTLPITPNSPGGRLKTPQSPVSFEALVRIPEARRASSPSPLDMGDPTNGLASLPPEPCMPETASLPPENTSFSAGDNKPLNRKAWSVKGAEGVVGANCEKMCQNEQSPRKTKSLSGYSGIGRKSPRRAWSSVPENNIKNLACVPGSKAVQEKCKSPKDIKPRSTSASPRPSLLPRVKPPAGSSPAASDRTGACVATECTASCGGSWSDRRRRDSTSSQSSTCSSVPVSPRSPLKTPPPLTRSPKLSLRSKLKTLLSRPKSADNSKKSSKPSPRSSPSPLSQPTAEMQRMLRVKNENSKNSSVTAKTKSQPSKPLPSYRQNTESSRSKVSKDQTSTTTTKTNSKQPSKLKKGRLSSSMKSKFKSTPNLALPSEGEPEVRAPPTSRTMDDINGSIKQNGSTAGKSKPLSSTSVSSSSKDPSSKSLNLSRRSMTAVVPNAVPADVADDKMPPPSSTSVLKSKDRKNPRRTTMPELTLSQAKNILLNKSLGEPDVGSPDTETDNQVLTSVSPVTPKDPSVAVKELEPSPQDLPERDTSSSASYKSASSHIPHGSGCDSGVSSSPSVDSAVPTPQHTTHLSSVNRTYVVDNHGEPDRALTPTHMIPSTKAKLDCSVSPIKPCHESPLKDSSVNPGHIGRRSLPAEPSTDAVSPLSSPAQSVKGKMNRNEILSSLLTISSDRQGSPPERLAATENAAPASPKGRSATLPRSSSRSAASGDRAKHALDEVQKLQQRAAHMQQQWEKRRAASGSPTKSASTKTPTSPAPPPASSTPTHSTHQSHVTETKETSTTSTVYLTRTLQVRQVSPPTVSEDPKPQLNGVASQKSASSSPSKSVLSQATQTSSPMPSSTDVPGLLKDLKQALTAISAKQEELRQCGDTASLQQLEVGISDQKTLISSTLGTPAPRFLAYVKEQNAGGATGDNLTTIFQAFTREVLDTLDHNIKAANS